MKNQTLPNNSSNHEITVNKNGEIEVSIHNKFILVPLMGVLIILILWCIYLRSTFAFMKRKRLLWVEVQDYVDDEHNISRIMAKKNLHLVAEIT